MAESNLNQFQAYKMPNPLQNQPPSSMIPQPVQWMPMPEVNLPGCPPGLEYLAQVDQLLVHQLIEIAEGW